MLSFLSGFFRNNKKNSVENVIETNSVSMEDVSFTRGENRVLGNISLELTEQRIGIIGNNGSGKSTFLKLLNGLLLPTEGEVNVFGYTSREHQEALPGKVGFIFQNPDHQIIFPTVLEELAFGLEQLGQKSDEARVNSRDFLRRYQSEDLADKPVQSLSEGQKQLVCILGILIMRPKLLLLDEPFSSLDFPTRRRLMSLIDHRAERLIMVTHDPQSLKQFDRVIWIHNGKVRMDGEPGNVINEYIQFSEEQVGKFQDWGQLS